MLLRRKPDLLAAISAAHARPLDRHAPSAERHLARLVTMADRGPVGVVFPPRANDIVERLLQKLDHHAEPNANRQRRQSLPRCPDQLPERLLDTLRQNGLTAGRLSDRYVALHGGSSLDLRTDHPPRPQPERTGRRDRRPTKFHELRDNPSAISDR